MRNSFPCLLCLRVVPIGRCSDGKGIYSFHLDRGPRFAISGNWCLNSGKEVPYDEASQVGSSDVSQNVFSYRRRPAGSPEKFFGFRVGDARRNSVVEVCFECGQVVCSCGQGDD